MMGFLDARFIARSNMGSKFYNIFRHPSDRVANLLPARNRIPSGVERL